MNFSRSTGPRRLILKGAAAVLALAASGVVAFATMSPDPGAETALLTRATVEAIPIRADQVLAAPETYIAEERYQRGDTLPAFIARLGVADAEASRLSRLRPLQQLRPGTFVRAEVDANGVPRSLSFLSGRDTLVQIVAEGSGAEVEYRTGEVASPLQQRIAMKSGTIRTSLFAATDAAGIPDAVGMQIADIFAGDVDFHRDLRKGDRFSVVYEEHHFAGMPVRAGRVLAAEFSGGGRTYRAILYGRNYYTPEGKNLRKAFLRSPLEFSRVSSGFGMRRHPIAQGWRAHKGIDYAAPIGTRVRAVGDGVVEHAGPKGGYGNVVIVRHHGQYATVYAHLSRVSVKRGERIAQNETIGNVGQTGWATGPHLHYEFRVAGEARNPFSIAMPAANPVPAQEMAQFREQADPLAARLDLVSNASLAMLE
ncbi:MAG TPA: peptidoglycan DD-metalloendopeptidase family protein [Burkholderiales bacterium]|nr:peptidoglycan DD-metalloendopeptidase family protein [Burkholderiales bacterium]